MYRRSHHQRIHSALEAMNADFLRDAKCYVGGGTAIALMLGEYRESLGMDFLCADQEGYRKIRASVFEKGPRDLFSKPVETIRDIRTDRDAIRAVLSVGGMPTKFEIVREARVELEGQDVPGIPVPCLTRNDLFAEKLLANADRYADKAVMSRDVIDLLVMQGAWGAIPAQAWDKASGAYGDSVRTAFVRAKEMLRTDPQYFKECLRKMDIPDSVGENLKAALGLGRNRSQSMPDLGR